MSVSAELLCSFELLKPLDSSALKSHIKKGRNKRQSMLNSPVGTPDGFRLHQLTIRHVAGKSVPAILLSDVRGPAQSGLNTPRRKYPSVRTFVRLHVTASWR